MQRTRLRGLPVVGYAVLAYAAFLASSVWSVSFLADAQLPRGIDHGGYRPPWLAVGVDSALLLLFALQHSVMARRGFKRRVAGWIPPHVERSTYVLATSITLVLLFWQWRPMPAPIWHLHGVAATAVWIVCALGWLLAVGSTFAVDHLDFFGLRRAYQHARGRRPRDAPFRERGLYGWVRHPLMLGLLVAFWATPRLTAGHLLFAAAATGYIAVGVQFEEHDLENELGDLYRDYAARVPAICPVRRPNESHRSDADASSTVDAPTASSTSQSTRQSPSVATSATPDPRG